MHERTLHPSASEKGTSLAFGVGSCRSPRVLCPCSSQWVQHSCTSQWMLHPCASQWELCHCTSQVCVMSSHFSQRVLYPGLIEWVLCRNTSQWVLCLCTANLPHPHEALHVSPPSWMRPFRPPPYRVNGAPYAAVPPLPVRRATFWAAAAARARCCLQD